MQISNLTNQCSLFTTVRYIFWDQWGWSPMNGEPCAHDIWWTLDFASAFLSPGVNSRAELVPSHGASRRRLGDNVQWIRIINTESCLIGRPGDHAWTGKFGENCFNIWKFLLGLTWKFLILQFVCTFCPWIILYFLWKIIDIFFLTKSNTKMACLLSPIRSHDGF
jgi:hypothetical protein